MQKCLHQRAVLLQNSKGVRDRPLAPGRCRPQAAQAPVHSRPLSASLPHRSGKATRNLNNLGASAADVESTVGGTATVERPSEDTRSLEYPSQAVNGRSNSSNGATSSLPSQTSPEIDEPSTSGSNAEQTYGEYSSRGADGGQSSSDPASERNSGRYIAAKDRKIGTPLQRTPSGMPRLIPPGEVNIKPGDRVVGSVVWSGPSGWKVELQAHKELIGFCPNNLCPHLLRDDFVKNMDPVHRIPRKGLVREFEVVSLPKSMQYNGRGPLLACLYPDLDLIWRRVEQVLEQHLQNAETLTVNLRGCNSGGLLSVFEGIPLFIPYCYIPKETSSNPHRESDYLEKHWVNKDVEVSLVQVVREKKRVVGSITQGDLNKALRNIKVGSLIWGKVRRVEIYGAFIGIDDTYVSGLLHVTNTSNMHVDNMFDVLDAGDRVRCLVTRVEDGATRISFSTAELEKEPGDFLKNKEKVYEDAEEMAENYRKRLAEMQVEGNFEDEPRMAQRESEPRRAQRESVPRRAQGEYDGRSVGIAEDLDW